MALWGKISTQANNKPKYLNTSGTYYNKNHCEGITVADAQAASGLLTSGWTQVHILRTGGVSSVVVNNGGTGYSNTTSVVTFTPAAGETASGAAASVVTNASGVITAINVSAAGSGYGLPPTVSVTVGSGASLTAVTSARKQFEPLVAIASMTS